MEVNQEKFLEGAMRFGEKTLDFIRKWFRIIFVSSIWVFAIAGLVFGFMSCYTTFKGLEYIMNGAFAFFIGILTMLLTWVISFIIIIMYSGFITLLLSYDESLKRLVDLKRNENIDKKPRVIIEDKD
jgi:hypothetical protein